MLALLIGEVRLPQELLIGRNQRIICPTTRQSMMMRHTCLCCSCTLLRHVRLQEIYWRCSHCYQEMPV